MCALIDISNQMLEGSTLDHAGASLRKAVLAVVINEMLERRSVAEWLRRGPVAGCEMRVDDEEQFDVCGRLVEPASWARLAARKRREPYHKSRPCAVSRQRLRIRRPHIAPRRASDSYQLAGNGFRPERHIHLVDLRIPHQPWRRGRSRIDLVEDCPPQGSRTILLPSSLRICQYHPHAGGNVTGTVRRAPRVRAHPAGKAPATQTGAYRSCRQQAHDEGVPAGREVGHPHHVGGAMC